MKDVLILGVDIHGIEMIEIINRSGAYRLLGFIRHDGYGGKLNAGDMFGGYPVLGDPEDLHKYPEAGFIPMHVWKSRDGEAQWVSLIDPSAFVSATASIGDGCVIYPNCFVGANAVFEKKVFMLSGSVVNHDCHICENVTITSGVILAGSVKAGAGAYLGQGCNIRQYLTIGTNAYVGMGAVVTKDIPEGVTVVGNPARVFIK
jgi:sugar O-acyltransferase (sialic acid O-acetyltransferase NeuD family)